MSFLSKIFKAKPGGTLLGNALRGVTSKLTGGILGQGALRDASLTQQGFLDSNGYPTSAYNDYERSKMTPEQQQIMDSAVAGAMQTPGAKTDVALAAGKQTWPWLLIALVAAGLLWLFRSKQNNKMTVNNGRNED